MTMKEYEASRVGDQQFSLVSPAWVAEHVNDEDLCLLDVRSDVHAYFAGHVPNAVHLADTTMRGPVNGLPFRTWHLRRWRSCWLKPG
jgi:thiosulfate/3-mercaptopyruvate sulfurtransferase